MVIKAVFRYDEDLDIRTADHFQLSDETLIWGPQDLVIHLFSEVHPSRVSRLCSRPFLQSVRAGSKQVSSPKSLLSQPHCSLPYPLQAANQHEPIRSPGSNKGLVMCLACSRIPALQPS